MSVVFLPLSKKPPFPSLALPLALSPLAEGPSPSEVSLVVCRVPAAPSVQGSAPSCRGWKTTGALAACSQFLCGGERSAPARCCGLPPKHLWSLCCGEGLSAPEW